MERKSNLHRWERTQRLIVDIINIQRHHYIPNTDKHENVAEHSFSVALLCWAIFDIVEPPLDLSKIFKYALAHDSLERGLHKDVSSFAGKEARVNKQVREAEELKKISDEFSDFGEFVQVLRDYEEKADEEALFVWSVDKLQPILLGYIDDWRPYKADSISFEDFCSKYDAVCEKCSPYIREIFREVYEYGKETYYDKSE